MQIGFLKTVIGRTPNLEVRDKTMSCPQGWT